MKKGMKKSKGTLLCIIFFFALMSMNCFLSEAVSAPLRLTTASVGVGSPPYLVVSNFAEAAKKGLPAGTVINVESSGTSANAARIGAGKLDFGLVNIIDVFLAVQGKPPFTEKLGKIRILCGLFAHDQEFFMFPVNKDTGLTSFEDIKNKKYPLTISEPMKGSGGELLTQMVLNAYGITYEDIESWGGKVTFTSFGEMRNLFKDGRVKASGSIAPFPHPGWMEVFTFQKNIRLLPVDNKEVLAELGKSGIVPITIKKGSYGVVEEDTPGISAVAFLAVREGLADDIVQGILKGAFGNIEIIRKSHPTMKNYSVENSYKYVAPFDKIVPFHPAALKFFKEKLGM